MPLTASSWQRLRVIVPLILLVMILMRLVWMQLRSYPQLHELRAIMSLDLLSEEFAPSCSYDRPNFGSSHPKTADSSASEATFRASRQWLSSYGYMGLGAMACRLGMLESQHIVRFNQWILAATVLMATLLVRFLTGAWTVALIVAAMLMSRGRLLVDIGSISPNGIVMLLVTTWLTCLAHYLRTGALVSLGAAAVVTVVGSLFEHVFLFLALAMPLMLMGGYALRRYLAGPFRARLRGRTDKIRQFAARAQEGPRITEVESRAGLITGTLRWMLGLGLPPLSPPPPPDWQPSQERGGLFRTLEIPFAMWVFRSKRWLKLTWGWLLLGVLIVLVNSWLQFGSLAPVSHILHGQSMTMNEALHIAISTLRAFAERFDLHLLLSLSIMILCALQSPGAGLTGFYEGVVLALLSLLVLVGGTMIMDVLDVALIPGLDELVRAYNLPPWSARPVALWLEPVILSLGAGGVYNLMKVLDTQMADRA